MIEVLEDENTTLLSDRDIFYLVNSKLPKAAKISESYFEFLKSPNQKNAKSISQLSTITEEEKEEFIEALNVARVKQKMALTKKAFDDKLKNAYPYLWSLERKNKELQLNRNMEQVNNQPLIQITASNDEHKTLIDNILKGNPVKLKPVEEEAEEVDYDEIIHQEKGENDVEPLIDNE
ncbi:hypothetical protein [Corallibacter sp.]|uniref:hypothetical protein n=1 Tax=Corallibacter sp. TaxID=2038084 RepID=UPI003AB29E91